MDLFQKTKRFIKTHELFQPGEKILVGVSGGPDSVALLHILNRLKFEQGLLLHIAHFNHQLRRGAMADQKHVERLSARWNIPCTVGVCRHPPSSKKRSDEESSRESRYAFLSDVALRIKADKIALAHHQDDLAETVLMRILRGTGLDGLRAILPLKTIHGFDIVRPLLSVKRREIDHYIKKNKLSFRLDPTNQTTKFFRNKIRLKLLPLLEKEYNKNIRSCLASLSGIATADYDFLEKEAAGCFSQLAKYTSKNKSIQLPLTAFQKLHPAMQRMLLRLCVKHLKGNTRRLSADHFNEIDGLLMHHPMASTVHFPSGITIQKDKRYLTVNS